MASGNSNIFWKFSPRSLRKRSPNLTRSYFSKWVELKPPLVALVALGSSPWQIGHKVEQVAFGKAYAGFLGEIWDLHNQNMVSLGGGFKYFLFSPLFGADSQFGQYFSNGLKPPTSVTILFGGSSVILKLNIKLPLFLLV